MPRKLLFVCLGNICRSPLAEGIFLHLCRERGAEARYAVDSAGTGGWHVGEPPDARAMRTAAKRGVPLPGVCRQVRAADFKEYDIILAMDANNRRDLLELCPPEARGKVKLMRDFDEEFDRGADVPDPYYGGPEGFEAVFDMLLRCCGRLLDELERESAGPGA